MIVGDAEKELARDDADSAQDVTRMSSVDGLFSSIDITP
jgi:hypothetical protein